MAKFKISQELMNKVDASGCLQAAGYTHWIEKELEIEILSDSENKNLPSTKSALEKIINDGYAEWETAQAKKKSDKVSAYRKLSMTDDEINAIDPTLLEE